MAMEIAVDEGSSAGLGTSTSSRMGSSASTPIDSSNIGFKLLKKHGWKEGTGLGVSEQGRLEPVEAFIKKNKRGLGAEKPKKAIKHSIVHDDGDQKLADKGKAKGVKGISKKMKKMQELEKRLQEKEFDRVFFREFWPDNV